jgi:hypothetical protein
MQDWLKGLLVVGIPTIEGLALCLGVQHILQKGSREQAAILDTYGDQKKGDLMRKYTFVTVVFGGDVELMSLQARSMDKYCPESLVEEILVIDNFTGEKPRGWLERTKSDYGKLWKKVRIIKASDITPSNGAGWWTQQALKLAVAKHVRSDRYVVLDAKNHLVKPLTHDFLEASGGKAKMNGYGYSNHPLQKYLLACCKYVGIDSKGPLSKFVRTSTPFTILTAPAKSVVAALEHKEKTNLLGAMTKNNLTEFFIYAAMLQHQGTLDEVYDWSQQFTADIWPHQGPDDNMVKKAIKVSLENSHGPFMAVHRGALKAMTPVGKKALAEFWVSRGLFKRTEDAYKLVN